MGMSQKTPVLTPHVPNNTKHFSSSNKHHFLKDVLLLWNLLSLYWFLWLLIHNKSFPGQRRFKDFQSYELFLLFSLELGLAKMHRQNLLYKNHAPHKDSYIYLDSGGLVKTIGYKFFGWLESLGNFTIFSFPPLRAELIFWLVIRTLGTIGGNRGP